MPVTDIQKPATEGDDEEFVGFDPDSSESDNFKEFSLRLETELSELTTTVEPTKTPAPAKKRKYTLDSEFSRTVSPSLSNSSFISYRSGGESQAESISSKDSKKSVLVDVSDPKLRVPFSTGWRRELVTRAQLDEFGREVKDVYYFLPSGKKLRSMREISQNLSGGLTLDNFTFAKQPLGLDPAMEVIRNARALGSPNLHRKSITGSPFSPSFLNSPLGAQSKSPSLRGVSKSPSISRTTTPSEPVEQGSSRKRLRKDSDTDKSDSKPKTEVNKSTEKLIKKKVKKKDKKLKLKKGSMKNKKGFPKISMKSNGSIGGTKTPKLILHRVDTDLKIDPNCPDGPRKKITTRKRQNNVATNSGTTAEGDMQMGMLPPNWSPSAEMNKSSQSYSWSDLSSKKRKDEDDESGRTEPCTISCTKAMGLIPTLQCSICLCLYHTECCDIFNVSPFKTIHNYVCKNCQVKAKEQKKKNVVKNIIPMLQSVESTPPLIIPKPINPTLSDGSQPSAFQPNPVPVHLPTLIRPKHNTKTSTTLSWLTPKPPPLIRTPVIQPEVQPLPPQLILSMNNRKYIFVPKTTSVLSSVEQSPVKTEPQSSPFLVNTPSAKQNLLFVIPTQNNEGNTSDTIINTTPTIPPHYFIVNSSTSAVNQPTLPKGSETQEHFSKNQPSQTVSPSTKIVPNFMRNMCLGYSSLLEVFQYLKVQELLRAARVCRLWRDITGQQSLWRTVRMKNSQVTDWKGFADALIRHGTKNLDLRKMLIPLDDTEKTWDSFIKEIARVNCLERLDLCRCSSSVTEKIMKVCPHLQVFNASLIGVKDASVPQILDLSQVAHMSKLKELRLKSSNFLSLTGNFKTLILLSQSLTTLSVTTCKLHGHVGLETIGQLCNLETLELGECLDVSLDFPTEVISKLKKLKRLRLEKLPLNCPSNEIMHEISKLRSLVQLELINVDVKPGFDRALQSCTNIEKLLLIPTYVTQSATTNQIILNGSFKLWKTLKLFVWVVTMELLKVTELFVDQCEGKNSAKSGGNCLPVLKPIPQPEVKENFADFNKKEEKEKVPPISVIPINELSEMLTKALPNTRVKVTKIPYQSTWRQAITDSVV